MWLKLNMSDDGVSDELECYVLEAGLNLIFRTPTTCCADLPCE